MHFFFQTDNFSLFFFELLEAKARLITAAESTAATSRSVVPEQKSKVLFTNLNYLLQTFFFWFYWVSGASCPD